MGDYRGNTRLESHLVPSKLARTIDMDCLEHGITIYPDAPISQSTRSALG
ncbi:hypothetical protein [Holospora curviuscula]|nr:hypothetical protein [Holospora curviuscula]